MARLIICITNDVDYDRRTLRIKKSLSRAHEVSVFSRRLHKKGANNKINCLFRRGFFFYAEYNTRLFFRLLFSNMDAVVAVDYDTLMATYFASKLRGKKLFFDAHELFEESIEISTRPRIQKFWKWVGKTFVPKVDRAYTVCESIAQYYENQFGIPFTVIRNVPRLLNTLPLRKQPAEKVILYQGVLNEGRKLEQLIDALQFLPDTFRVWVIGEGDLSKKLRKKASTQVIFFGWIKPEALPEYTSQAFLTYNLLDDKSKSYCYSLANKFFDYLHAGIPSLNNPYPEYQAMNERYNCCYIKDVKEAAELANWILDIEKDPEAYKEKKKNAFLASLDLNWEKEQNKLMSIYDFDRHTDL